jgi:hypothetical protein
LKEKNFNFQKLCKILEEIQHFQIKLEKCVAKFAILYRGWEMHKEGNREKYVAKLVWTGQACNTVVLS